MPTLFCYRGRTGLALAAFLAGANLCAPGARAQASAPGLVRLPDGGSTATIVVPAGKTRTLDSTTSYIDLVVGDPDIADAMPLTDHSFYIHGKKAGATTISAYDASKNLVGSLEVEVGADIGRLNADLRRELGGSRVHATSVNGHIMMKGVAQDAVSLDRARAKAK
jgi:pilus assembly protein CpaC